MRCYWTNDWNDQGSAMREGCRLHAVGSREEAMRAAVIDLAARVDLVPGDCIEVDCIDDGGCWAKLPLTWTHAMIEEHLASRGIDVADYMLHHVHPGPGDVVWVSVTAPVYAAQVAGDHSMVAIHHDEKSVIFARRARIATGGAMGREGEC